MKYTKSIADMEETELVFDDDLFLITTGFNGTVFDKTSSVKAVSAKQIKKKLHEFISAKFDAMP